MGTKERKFKQVLGLRDEEPITVRRIEDHLKSVFLMHQAKKSRNTVIYFDDPKFLEGFDKALKEAAQNYIK